MTSESPPADERSPDHSTCRNCGTPVTWDDWCYVHDANGFADCGLVVSGGTPLAPGVLLNPRMSPLAAGQTGRAEPVEWDA